MWGYRRGYRHLSESRKLYNNRLFRQNPIPSSSTNSLFTDVHRRTKTPPSRGSYAFLARARFPMSVATVYNFDNILIYVTLAA